jgi:RNA recognition motif-containing protein
LKTAFEGHSMIVSAKVILDRESGRIGGLGFVKMGNLEEAKSAIDALNDSDIEGRNILVNEANPCK